MAQDTYVKFGSRKERAPAPYNTPLPLIEGDSGDSLHYWWTEARSCSFGLTGAERTTTGEDATDKTKNRPKPGNVTITKKVDWGSADLFQKCCEAPEALKKKSDEENPTGVIDQVTVEVCRPDGEGSDIKFPFLIVRYYKVCVISYEIEFSGPDPTETVILKYETADFEYVQTDPYTGGRKGGAHKATGFVRFEADASTSEEVAAGLAGVAASVAGGSLAAAAGNPAAATAAASASLDVSVAANFPGYASVTGNGVLPD